MFKSPYALFAAGISSCVLFSTVMAQETTPKATDTIEARTSAPADVFQGCKEIVLPKTESTGTSPSDRIRKTPGVGQEIKTDKKVRILQGQPLDSTELDADPNKNLSCWSRLDGVWREDRRILLDQSVDPESWEGGTPSMRSLAHGTYTTPKYFTISQSDDMEKTLILRDTFDPTLSETFVSTDGITFEEVLKRGGKKKSYVASTETIFGEELSIDVSRSGFIRVSLDGQIYKRPSPGVTSSSLQNQYAMDEIFLISYNLENMIANRKGYDITSQDPFRVLRNDKAEIFQEVTGHDYKLFEKRTVPLGFHLVQEIDQGMVYTKSSSSTTKELQEKNRWAYGAKARVGKGGTLAGTSPSVSAGVDFVNETASTMRSTNMASQAVGYSRTKQYALVVDHPFIELHPDFIDAVEDARRYGDEDPKMYDRIIDKFGTHYPYAVTYGANAKMTFSYSEKETFNRNEKFNSEGATAEIEAVYGAVEGYINNERTDNSENNKNNSDERSTFEAVGGNGSWDEKGFSAGQTPYPILLDLRSIGELLNPMNFPGEEDVYGKVRQRLEARIIDYLALRAAGLNDWPIVSTTLDGHYVSDAFPEMLFHFTAKDFANSDVEVLGRDGRNFVELMRDYIAREIYKPIPEILHQTNDIGLQYKQFYDRESPRIKVPLTVTRAEGGGYGYSKNLMALVGSDRYTALQTGVIDAANFDLIMVLGKFNEQSRWQYGEDGELLLRTYPDAKPIVFTRITKEDVAAQKRPALTGDFTTDKWPGFKFSFNETPYGSTEATIYRSSGAFFLAPDQEEIDRLTAGGMRRDEIRKTLEKAVPFEIIRIDSAKADYRHPKSARRIEALHHRGAVTKRRFDVATFGGRIPVETATWHFDGVSSVVLKFNDEAKTEIVFNRHIDDTPVTRASAE